MSVQPDNLPLLWSTTESRRQLGGVSRETLYQLLNKRELASIKLGRKRLILAESVRSYVARQAAEQDA